MKDSRLNLRRRLEGLSWKDIPAITFVATRGMADTSGAPCVHPRHRLDQFPARPKVLQICRTRSIKGRKATEVVYAIGSST